MPFWPACAVYANIVLCPVSSPSSPACFPGCSLRGPFCPCSISALLSWGGRGPYSTEHPHAYPLHPFGFTSDNWRHVVFQVRTSIFHHHIPIFLFSMHSLVFHLFQKRVTLAAGSLIENDCIRQVCLFLIEQILTCRNSHSHSLNFISCSLKSNVFYITSTFRVL